MAEYNGKTGVWRTVGGRRIFIADGEDLASAMKKSGKFKNKKDLTEDDISKKEFQQATKIDDKLDRAILMQVADDVGKELDDDSIEARVNYVRNNYNGNATDKEIFEKLKSEYKNRGWYIEKEKSKFSSNLKGTEINAMSIKNNEGISQDLKMADVKRIEDAGNHYDIEMKDGYMSVSKDRVTSINNLNYQTNANKLYANDRYLDDGKEIHDTFKQMDYKEMKAFSESHPESIKKMQAYIKDKNDYELYKRAKLAPDSIDPMTENSTDWGALDKKYSERFKNDPSNYFSNTRDYDMVQLDYDAYRRRLEQVEYKINDDRLDSMQHADYRKERNDIKLKMQNLDYERNRAIKNEYNQYKKEHPNTDLTYEDYKKIKRGY